MGGIYVDFSVVNQLNSPALNSNTIANRPAAGQAGRLFISTDTFEIYRDNGTTWDLIGGPGSSTITGSGAATQVAYFNASQSITGSNGLWFNPTNDYLGIGINAPSGLIHADGGANVARMILDADNNVARIFSFRTDNSQRFAFRVDGDETGGNAGANFQLRRYDDTGNFIDASLIVNRATGKKTFNATQNYTSGLATGNSMSFTLNIPNGTTFTNPNSISPLQASMVLNLAGNATIASGSRTGADLYNFVSFANAGTLTMSQASTIRALSNIKAGWAYTGAAIGTITHNAGINILFPDNSGQPVNITNNYALLINTQTANTGTITYTNRWGIYQEGSADLNYLNGNLLIKSTTDNGNALQVTGNSFTSGTVLFGSSSSADAYVRTNTVSTTARKGLYLNNGTNTALLVYAGGGNTLGAWTESDRTLVIGTSFFGGGGSQELILFHSAGVGNMFALDAATTRAYLYFPMTASSNISATSFIPTGSTIPTNGMFLSAANTLAFSTNTAQRVTISNSGAVGIGNLAPVSLLSLAGTYSKNLSNEDTWHLQIKDNTAMTTGVGGGIVLTGNYTTGGAAGSFAAISGFKENSTSSNGLGQLRLYTSDTNSVLQLRATINGAGNFLINTTTDAGQSLQVNGTTLATAFTATNGVYDTTSATNYWFARVQGNNRIIADSTGYIYMPFLTSGSGIDDLGWWGTSSGSWTYDGMLMRISSSARYKKNIRDIDFDTAKIYELRAISYENNENTAVDGLTSFGLLAEEVAEILPQLATYNKDNQPEGVQYKMLSVLILNELKKLKKEIEILKQN